MSIRRFAFLYLAVVGCAAAAYAIGRHTRYLEKRQLDADLRTWEDEGGNMAPLEPLAVTRPAAVRLHAPE